MMRRFAAWLYFLGAVAVVTGAIMYASHIPDAPDEDDLVPVSGFLVAIQLEKDFDGTDVVYFRFRDQDTRYKYLSTYPKYVEVRDRLGIYRDIDLMIEEGASPGRDGALKIWGLVEHDPYHEGTVVTFQEIYDETMETDLSYQNISYYMLGGGLLALLIGYLIRRMMPYVPRDPRA